MNLYILKCKDGKYYVGTTNLDTSKRLMQHMKGNGSAWTKKYKPLWIEKEILNCDKYDEDKWTKVYMDKYGINNVRGGSYSQIKLPNNTVDLLEREVNHANQKCLFCGKSGHFIKQCPYKKDTINKKFQSKNLHYLNMSCNYESADEISYESESESESDEELTIEQLEAALDELDKDDGVYRLNGVEYFWENGNGLFEESLNNPGHRNGTFGNQYGNWKPIKKKKAKSPNKASCYRCGRNGHYSSKCYAKKHVKGYYLKN